MNILFLTLLDFKSINEHNIYTDLLREFVKHGHKLYIVSPVEKRQKVKTHIIEQPNVMILKLKTGNIQKTNIIEKGLSMVRLESQFIKGIKRYLSNVQFDLIIYSTPPITICNSVSFVKKRDNAKTYLMLKDIFPQNAVDIGILPTTPLKGVLYRQFRNIEKKLYSLSDFIGCMSPTNVHYVIKHNPEVEPKKVEICPNSIEVIDKSIDNKNRTQIRKKYSIPLDKKVFIYGGNLGKPQGIDFLISCIQNQKDNENIFYLIIGDGTEYKKIEKVFINQPQKNLKLMMRLPKEDYDTLVAACDVGMIFLDHRFTIPNFPSRLLSYLQAKIPVLACTDSSTDIGKIIIDGKFGWWCESNNLEKFNALINSICGEDLRKAGELGYQYMQEHYSVEKTYSIIINHFM